MIDFNKSVSINMNSIFSYFFLLSLVLLGMELRCSVRENVWGVVAVTSRPSRPTWGMVLIGSHVPIAYTDSRVLQKGHFSTKKPRETRHVNIWPIRNHFKPKKVPKLQCRGSDLSVQNWHFVWFLLWFFKLVVLKNLPQKVQSFKIPIFCAFKVQTTLV